MGVCDGSPLRDGPSFGSVQAGEPRLCSRSREEGGGEGVLKIRLLGSWLGGRATPGRGVGESAREQRGEVECRVQTGILILRLLSTGVDPHPGLLGGVRGQGGTGWASRSRLGTPRRHDSQAPNM